MVTIQPDRFETGRPMLLAGLRRHHACADAPAGIAAQWAQFRTIDELPERVGATSFGALCGHDAGTIEYLSGVEVSSFDRLPAGMGRMRVPAQTYAVFTHPGPASELHLTWEKIFDWLRDSDFESANAPDFERYGPDFDPATGTGNIEVWIGIVPKQTARP